MKFFALAAVAFAVGGLAVGAPKGRIDAETSGTYPVPKNTFLPVTNSSGTRVLTFYFRTQFMFSGDTNALRLGLNGVIDDGAVFYLNGTEVLRYNMPATNINYNTLASTNVNFPGLTGTLPIPAGSL